jgi:thiamine biosynthesis lipoprotein
MNAAAAAGGVVCLCASLLACSDVERQIFSDSSILMGTFVEITVAERSEKSARAAIRAALEEISRVDELSSAYNPQSALRRVNLEAYGKPVVVDRGLFDLIRDSVAYSAASGGAFDITVQPVMALWSFDSGGKRPDADRLRQSLPLVGSEHLVLDEKNRSVGFKVPGMGIDLGAIAAGWAADRAMARMEALGVENAIVDAGGEIRVRGTRPDGSPWRIGIRHPRAEGVLLAKLELTDTAIATSGDYERFFEEGGVRYHHILDPATGMPASGCRSVTVLASTASEADACSTAAFVLGPERGIAFLKSRPGVRGVIVDAAGALHWTDDDLRKSARR